MATKWETVKYLSRVRPDSDDGRTDDCNDSSDEDDLEVQINGKCSVQPSRSSGERFNFKACYEKPILHHSQPILKTKSFDCLRLPVPQNIRRSYKHEEADATPVRRASSVYSLFNGHEIDGDIPKRSHSLHKNNRRVLLKDLFSKFEVEKSYRFKVSRCALILTSLQFFQQT